MVGSVVCSFGPPRECSLQSNYPQTSHHVTNRSADWSVVWMDHYDPGNPKTCPGRKKRKKVKLMTNDCTISLDESVPSTIGHGKLRQEKMAFLVRDVMCFFIFLSFFLPSFLYAFFSQSRARGRSVVGYFYARRRYRAPKQIVEAREIIYAFLVNVS